MAHRVLQDRHGASRSSVDVLFIDRPVGAELMGDSPSPLGGRTGSRREMGVRRGRSRTSWWRGIPLAGGVLRWVRDSLDSSQPSSLLMFFSSKPFCRFALTPFRRTPRWCSPTGTGSLVRPKKSLSREAKANGMPMPISLRAPAHLIHGSKAPSGFDPNLSASPRIGVWTAAVFREKDVSSPACSRTRTNLGGYRCSSVARMGGSSEPIHRMEGGPGRPPTTPLFRVTTRVSVSIA
jgi:hypothetical protein